MKRILICILLSSLVLFSCKRNDRRTMLIGTWHAVKLENSEMDSFFTNSQAYIDTIGKGNDSATNVQIYGVANMDSMRQVLQQQYNSAKKMQTDAVNNTVFTFRNDSTAVLSFNGNTDSCSWYFDDKGVLVLDQFNGKGASDKVKMDIISLSDTALKLRFAENGASSTVTFHPEGK